MTRALITGAGGFVGRNLVPALQTAGREPIAMVHSEQSTHFFKDLDVETIVADIRDVQRYRERVGQVDEIYHLASVVAPRKAELAFDVNVHGTKLLAECIARSMSPARMIYVSSLSASGPVVGEHARRESDTPSPVSIYGKSKRAAEQELIALAQRAPISIVRPPGIFGPWDRNLLAMYQSIRKRVNVIGISRRYRYSFVHVDDLTDGLIRVADQGKRLDATTLDAGGGIYFISDPTPITFEELGNMIARSLDRPTPFHLTVPSTICWSVAFCADMASRLTGRRVYLNIDKMREARAGSWYCDVSKARDELRFEVSRPLEDRVVKRGDGTVNRVGCRCCAWSEMMPSR
ncbi:MAG: NAD-dependent epimerase/dehydratase family protein [Pirellulaceae bacterium]